MAFKWTPETDAVIRSLEVVGRTYTEVANELGITRSKVKWRVKQLGVKTLIKRLPPLTPEQKARVESSVHIAVAAAKNRLRPGDDPDEFLSASMYELVRSAVVFDPALSPNGEEGWGPYAYRNCFFCAIKPKRSRKAKLYGHTVLSLNDISFSLPERPKSGVSHAVRDDLMYRLKRLKPRARLVVKLVTLQGYMKKDVAAMLKISGERVRQIYERALQSMRLVVPGKRRRGVNNSDRLKKWVRDNPEEVRRAKEKASQSRATSAASEALERRASGHVFPRMWYRVDRTLRTLTGPYLHRGEAGQVLSDRLTRITLLLDQFTTSPELAEAMDCSINSMSNALAKLESAGVAVRDGRRLRDCGEYGQPAIEWRRVVDVVEAVRGREALKLVAQGYDVRMAMKNEGDDASAYIRGRGLEVAPVEAAGVATGGREAVRPHGGGQAEVLETAVPNAGDGG